MTEIELSVDKLLKNQEFISARKQFSYINHLQDVSMLLKEGKQIDKLDNTMPLLLNVISNLFDACLSSEDFILICDFPRTMESYHPIIRKYCCVNMFTDIKDGFNLANAFVCRTSFEKQGYKENMLSQLCLTTDDPYLNLDELKVIDDESEVNSYIKGNKTILNKNCIYVIKEKTEQVYAGNSQIITDYIIYIPHNRIRDIGSDKKVIASESSKLFDIEGNN